MTVMRLFAHGKTPNEQLLPPNDIAQIGNGHQRVSRRPSQIGDSS
jgi:hypothetical protein